MGPLREQLRLNKFVRVRRWSDRISGFMRCQRTCKHLLKKGPCEGTVRRWLSAHQERELSTESESASTLIFDSTTGKKNFCCLRHPVYCILLWQHELANTVVLPKCRKCWSIWKDKDISSSWGKVDHVTVEAASESLETQQMSFPVRGNMMNKADGEKRIGNQVTKRR